MTVFDSYLTNERSDNAVGYMGTFSGVTVGATYTFGRDAVVQQQPTARARLPETSGPFCKQYKGLLGEDYQNVGVTASSDQMRGNTGSATSLPSALYTGSRAIVKGHYEFSLGKVSGGWIRRNLDAGASSLQPDGSGPARMARSRSPLAAVPSSGRINSARWPGFSTDSDVSIGSGVGGFDNSRVLKARGRADR